MQYISIIEAATKEAILAFTKEKNIPEETALKQQHPQEDYLLISDNPPIFAVADGVTLNFKKLLEDNEPYPNPSPAGQVAQIYCESVIKSATDKYDQFEQDDISKVFKEANREVEKYNKAIGQSSISGNQTGFYSATGSFVIIKGNKGYWSSICDAYVCHFDKDMNKKFMSSGNCNPYAVINGEERMVEYIESGVFDLSPGDILFVLSDGFEYYVKNPDFLKLFKNWNDQLEDEIFKFTEIANEREPEHYGHERSLIAIRY